MNRHHHYFTGSVVRFYLVSYVAVVSVLTVTNNSSNNDSNHLCGGLQRVAAFSSPAISSLHSTTALSPRSGPFSQSMLFPDIDIGMDSDRRSKSKSRRQSPTTVLQMKLKKARTETEANVDADVETARSADESAETPVTDVRGPFALLLASQFLLFIGVGAVIPSIPLYGKEIGLSGASNGIVISAPAVALFLVANWSGRRADIARKPAMMIGMAVIAVSDIGTALAGGIYTLVLARLGLGAGRSLSEAGERGMLVDLANRIPELRGRALAAQQAVVALGIAIGAPAGGVVVENYGPRAAFVCVSVAAFVALILYAFLPETVAQRSSVSSTMSSSSSSSSTEPNSATPGLEVWKTLLERNEWRGLAICQSGVSFGYAAKIASIPILAASALPGGALGAGALLSAAGLSGLVGAPIGGYATDKIGSKGAALVSGVVGSLGLILIPLALLLEGSNGNGNGSDIVGVGVTAAPSWFANINSILVDHTPELSIGGALLDARAVWFAAAVLLWSLGASAQGPALAALAQQKSGAGVEATSLSLVKAAGDGTYIVAPFLLGLATDALSDRPGIDCALAGTMGLLGLAALAGLVPGEEDQKVDG